MRIFLSYLFAAAFGGTAYCTIEMVWRGRTHYSMFFAGAIIFSTFCYFSLIHKNTPLMEKCLFGAFFITAVELIFGIVFNLILKMGVWDYSNMPLNFLGQICLPYSMLWLLVSFIIFKWIVKGNFIANLF